MNNMLKWRPPLWVAAVLMGTMLLVGTGGGFVLGAGSNLVRSMSASTAAASSGTGACTESAEVCEQFDAFWEVWNVAEARFLDPTALDSEEMVTGAINGMLDTLNDRGHTRYDTAEQYAREREQQSGRYQGIGAYINEEGGLPYIVAPIEGSPAEAAGIQAGDTIIAVDGEQTEGMTLEDAVSKVRGEPGTQVTLEIMRRGNEAAQTFTITRAAITVPAVTWRMLPGDVAHVKLSQFSEKADSEMDAALQAAKDAGAQKYVLDLRNNPGGLLDQAVKVTGRFLPRDSVILQIRERDQTIEEAQKLRASVSAPDTTTPMVVLINGGSASSSEIFAGALQDYQRATVIGVETIGLGTVVSPIELDDGSAVFMGTAEWLTPNGRPLRHEGVTPDLPVALEGENVQALTPTTSKNLSDQEILEGTDTQLRKGLEILGVPGVAPVAQETP